MTKFAIMQVIAEAGQQARIFADGYYFRGRINSHSRDCAESAEHHNKLADEFAQWFAERVAAYVLNDGNLPLDIPTAFLRWTEDN